MNKQDIIKLLETNDKAVARALVAINDRQTEHEQASEATINHNGRGFRPCHARMGTSMAKFYQRNGYLTAKQIAYWRKPMKNAPMKIAIYAGQLLEVAAEKARTNTGSYAAGAAQRDNRVRVNSEFEMQAMEAAADREGTARDNAAKFAARCAMETA